ncbi:hypothetical protein IC235_19310 [Hymenobacter sp. BT664]|uniref:DUF4369 domain-containing protein n=1 Tax=Hymenobacter montanus TaxID=2771359 RepID=A0A927BHD7_9BACT|nr:hypothetical protein [Hymenobacter montanus]MBD2770042.1 hypothetical protein [Hymenobacter montanus]
MTTDALRLPIAAALSFLLFACSPSDTDKNNTGSKAGTTPKKAEPAFFVGTIRLLERQATLGDDLDYVIITLNGPRLRREVRSHSFTDSTERHGIIADLRTDSVTYYVQDATHNDHCSLKRAEYLERVRANTPILTSPDKRPYSSVFAPLPSDAGSLHQVVKPVLTLGSLHDCREILYFFEKQTRCEVIYSEQVRAPAEVLAYVEHNSPATLPSLALAVHYATPDPDSRSSLFDDLRNRLRREFFPDVQFSGLDSSRPPSHAFDLPSGSSYHSVEGLEAALGPADTGGHHHHHHHH